ncbi:sigma factor-like helix-turn-helix DNA-binding protein [Nocardia sp. NPDC059246]|uniref:sigma factor-like helix-turn-helix DNA-binding protein n=1 Tax=unclassified Nocardia TaxID=2637762 RepID=UPI003683C536
MNSPDLPADLTPDEARTYVVTVLDAVRKAEQTNALHKVMYMGLGRRYGLSFAEIAECLGMSESGVRRAIQRAEATPGGEGLVA